MDMAVKVVPGKGEIGIDSEASHGNGRYYVKLYNGAYDTVGFFTEQEALDELQYLIQGDRDV
jgi:hypothetical protein